MSTEKKTETLLSLKTAHNSIEVVSDGITKSLKFNASTQGSLLLDSNLRSGHFMQLGFQKAWNLNSKIRDILEIGLGIGNLTRAILERYPETFIDIAEIDSEVVNIAEKEFGFEPNHPQLSVHVTDGRSFIKQTHKKYDAVFVDAFISRDNSSFLPFDLVTTEAFLELKKVLNPNGLVAIHNVEGNEENLNLLTYQIAQTMSLAFPFVFVVPIGKGHNYIYGCLTAPEGPQEGVFCFEANAKGYALTDEHQPQNQVLMPYWVREWNQKALQRPYQLQKFTLEQAQTLSVERIQRSLKPWLEPLAGYTGKGVSVYAVDTGVTTSHQEFKKSLAEERLYTSASAKDPRGHGTHLASLVCGENIGLAPGCTYLGLNAFANQAITEVKHLVKALETLFTLKTKEQLAILSAPYTSTSSPELDQLFTRLSDYGYICILGAGNQNDDVKKYSPAGHPRCITVGAFDHLKLRWPFGNFGEDITISVIGQNIVGAHHDNPEAYFWMSGTSVSCALVTGLAALYFEKFPTHTVENFREFLKENN